MIRIEDIKDELKFPEKAFKELTNIDTASDDIVDMTAYVKRLEQYTLLLKSNEDRAYQMLRVYGVPEERAKSISNGIEVLVTRFDRQVVSMQYEIDSLRKEKEI